MIDQIEHPKEWRQQTAEAANRHDCNRDPQKHAHDDAFEDPLETQAYRVQPKHVPVHSRKYCANDTDPRCAIADTKVSGDLDYRGASATTRQERI